MTTFYIAGPMRGYPEYNHPAFRSVASYLRSCGHVVLNPADNFGGNTGLLYEVYMMEDLRMVLDADAIVLLPGWESSEGAQVEALVGHATGKAFAFSYVGLGLVGGCQIVEPLPAFNPHDWINWERSAASV